MVEVLLPWVKENQRSVTLWNILQIKFQLLATIGKIPTACLYCLSPQIISFSFYCLDDLLFSVKRSDSIGEHHKVM